MSRKKYRIGLLVDYIVSEYSSLIIQGVKTACRDFDIELIVFTIGELHSTRTVYEYQYIAITSLVNKHNLDGIVMTSGTQTNYLSKEELCSYVRSFSPLPIVNIAAEIPGVPSIIVNPYNAYSAIIEELINTQKCKRFGIVGVRGNSVDVKNRISCIEECLMNHNVNRSDICLWLANYDYSSTFRELSTYYRNTNKFDFDTIFAVNDEMAFACIDFCRSINKCVPEDVVVIGFDNLSRDAFSNPSLTSITQDIPNQGYSAAVTLKQILDGFTIEKSMRKLEAKVIFRDSTKRFPYSKNLMKNQCVKEIYDKNTTNDENPVASEWYLKRSEFLQLSQFYTALQTTMSMQSFKARINNDLQAFGITSCAIVLYENPVEMVTPFDYFNLPHKASILSAFDYKTGFDSTSLKNVIKFDPNEKLVPDDVLSFNCDGMYAMSLYHETLQYGYIIYRPGKYDVVCYEMLIKIISSLVSSSYQFTLVHNEQAKFKDKSDKLNVIAKTDELTGLFNRRGLYDMGKKTLKFAQSMKQSGIIVYCDMDGLKRINDSFGHEAGDKAIAAQGEILKNNFRSNDIVSRIGGDEFAIICPGLSPESFVRIKNQINRDCQKWTTSNSSPFTLGISMGCIAYPGIDDDYSITSLLAAADSKLYEEKHKKKNYQ